MRYTIYTGIVTVRDWRPVVPGGAEEEGWRRWRLANLIEGELLQTPQGASLLTPRQAEVVKLAQRGLVAKEIARQLGISKRTVEAHLGEARRRVGVTSTVALVGSVIVGARATGGGSSYSCSEIAGISEQVITSVGAEPPPRDLTGSGAAGRPS